MSGASKPRTPADTEPEDSEESGTDSRNERSAETPQGVRSDGLVDEDWLEPPSTGRLDARAARVRPPLPTAQRPEPRPEPGENDAEGAGDGRDGWRQAGAVTVILGLAFATGALVTLGAAWLDMLLTGDWTVTLHGNAIGEGQIEATLLAAALVAWGWTVRWAIPRLRSYVE